MRKVSVLSIIGSLIILLSNGAFAQSDDMDASDGDTGQIQGVDNPVSSGSTVTQTNGLGNIKISGWGGFEFGQIMHGFFGPDELNHRWQEGFRSRLNISSPVNDRLLLNFGTEISYQYSITAAQTNFPSYLPGVNFALDRADLSYKLLRGHYPITIQVGYFPFKYNTEARNLGEYLFRSGCYPNYLTNNFDFPLSRLLGFNIDNVLLEGNDAFSAHQNFMVTSETEIYPYEDISLSYLLALSIFKDVFKIGGGICGQRMFSVNESYTTPHSSQTISEINNVRSVFDSLSGTTITTGDTTFYSFAGTKLMAHATFDPKPLIPWNIFGAEDLKLYGEMAVLGLKNYPVYTDSLIRYDILSERMPFMVGFNFPTFKILDVLSLEYEYFPNRYYSSYFNELVGKGTRLPIPLVQAVGDRPAMDTGYTHFVKWSVYAKKSLGKHVELVAQFARDHRHAFFSYSDPRYVDFGDNLSAAKDWYYLIKIAYGF
jgi:hypothetical protein